MSSRSRRLGTAHGSMLRRVLGAVGICFISSVLTAAERRVVTLEEVFKKDQPVAAAVSESLTGAIDAATSRNAALEVYAAAERTLRASGHDVDLVVTHAAVVSKKELATSNWLDLFSPLPESRLNSVRHLTTPLGRKTSVTYDLKWQEALDYAAAPTQNPELVRDSAATTLEKLRTKNNDWREARILQSLSVHLRLGDRFVDYHSLFVTKRHSYFVVDPVLGNLPLIANDSDGVSEESDDAPLTFEAVPVVTGQCQSGSASFTNSGTGAADVLGHATGAHTAFTALKGTCTMYSDCRTECGNIRFAEGSGCFEEGALQSIKSYHQVYGETSSLPEVKYGEPSTCKGTYACVVENCTVVLGCSGVGFTVAWKGASATVTVKSGNALWKFAPTDLGSCPAPINVRTFPGPPPTGPYRPGTNPPQPGGGSLPPNLGGGPGCHFDCRYVWYEKERIYVEECWLTC